MVNIGDIIYHIDHKIPDMQFDLKFVEILSSIDSSFRNIFYNKQKLPINFDLGDAYWLKGYSNIIMSMLDIMLAHEGEPVFNQIAHNLFFNVNTDITPFLKKETRRGFDVIADFISGIHVLNLKVIYPDRLIQAHKNLKKVIQCSRLSWKNIMKENDNDLEWIPGSRQDSVTGFKMNQERIDGWLTFIDYAEKVLDGDILIPHWRFDKQYGINLKKVFETNRQTDLVMWVQGTSALPYLEKGNVGNSDIITTMNRLFNGNFLSMAAWIN